METTRHDARMIARLNDLLRLDHDAVQAYSLAIRELGSEARQQQLRTFREDHERHIRELTAAIREGGGMPVPLPHEAGAFKLALQALAGIGDDAAVLRAFRVNERQVRDKYARMADGDWPAELGGVVQRAAADEAKHFEWVEQTLREMGHEPGALEDRAGRVHQRMADMMESTERGAMRAFEGGRRVVRDHPAATIAGFAAIVVTSGLLARRLMR